MGNLKLYEIDYNLECLLNEINFHAEHNEGEIPEELDSYLDEMLLEKEVKVLDISRYIKSLKAEAEAIKGEVDKLTKRKQTLSNFAYRLKQYLLMHLHSGEKYSDSNTKLSWRKSESVNVIDLDLIPDGFCDLIKKPQLSVIKKHIKSGEQIGGVSLVEKHNLIIS